MQQVHVAVKLTRLGQAEDKTIVVRIKKIDYTDFIGL
jgi:hypothetical protein